MPTYPDYDTEYHPYGYDDAIPLAYDPNLAAYLDGPADSKPLTKWYLDRDPGDESDAKSDLDDFTLVYADSGGDWYSITYAGNTFVVATSNKHPDSGSVRESIARIAKQLSDASANGRARWEFKRA